jgi:aquaporin Z
MAESSPVAKSEVRGVLPVWEQALLGHHPPWVQDFNDLRYEWRRVFAEGLGTFLLVVVGAGGGMVNVLTHGGVGPDIRDVAPALMVMGVILATGAVGGAHLNPVVSVAFAMRREFPWKRVPGYIFAQLAGSTLACLLLWAVLGKVGQLGATNPSATFNDPHAMIIEALLTFGLVTVILGTASGAQNVGPLSALAVAGYISTAGFWAGSLTGAVMNPARAFGPDLALGHFTNFWVYLAGPTIGMVVAVGCAIILRGFGGDGSAARAAQGTLGTLVIEHSPATTTGAAHGQQ